MKTYHVFQSQSSPDLLGFADDALGRRLPPEDGPWKLIREIAPHGEWDVDVSRAIVANAINQNGFYLSGPRPQRTAKSVIESDRVEGTAVYDTKGDQVGTIKRLFIEKASGRVLYVDVTFGGFLGIGVHHHTIPWEKLAFDRELGGYRTDVTAEQVRSAPSYFGDGEIWHDRNREQQMRDYWSRPF